MTDILKHLLVDVHCGHCGDFTIGAELIAESQRMLAEGCPGSPYECPPEVFAPLLDPAALASLEKAWTALEAACGSRARQVALGDQPHLVIESIGQGDATALARWEDDGGSSPRAQWCAQC